MEIGDAWGGRSAHGACASGNCNTVTDNPGAGGGRRAESCVYTLVIVTLLAALAHLGAATLCFCLSVLLSCSVCLLHCTRQMSLCLYLYSLLPFARLAL